MCLSNLYSLQLNKYEYYKKIEIFFVQNVTFCKTILLLFSESIVLEVYHDSALEIRMYVKIMIIMCKTLWCATLIFKISKRLGTSALHDI